LPSQVAYIGDDIMDLPVIRHVTARRQRRCP
jgi:3-deoxy-D-manno-octulosonate 8-phosphate phosphatase KdsC-like HAD superfamily phosphatase